MPKINLNGFSEEEFDDTAGPLRGRAPKIRYAPRARGRADDHTVLDEIAAHGGLESEASDVRFNPTFSSSRYERQWILDYLGVFYDNEQITDVLHLVKGGKEANVYCCTAHPSTGLRLIAAKVYRPHMFRRLRNDAQYRQGRAILNASGHVVRDSRAMRAVAGGSGFGRELAHESWLEHEYQTLVALHAAGAGVPRPVARGNNTILMEYVGEVSAPAPMLSEVRLERDEVRPLWQRLVRDVEIMLRCERVHGDLSAYNVLYWEGDVKLIDFPQVVDPYTNPDAYTLFRRDVQRLWQYFSRYGIGGDPAALARRLWAQSGLPTENDLSS